MNYNEHEKNEFWKLKSFEYNNKKLSPDHCHKTMAFRGWVCHDCNTTLGRMDDNPQFLINAIEYLQKDPIPDPPKQQLSLELEEFTLEKQNEME